MARAKKSAASLPPRPNRRGSPEAVQKRRVARRFNDLLSGKSASASGRRDGRTEKRRRRLLTELQKGTRKGKEELKPIEVLRYVHELLELGESLTAIRKIARVRTPPLAPTDETVEMLRQLHASYRFRLEAYRFLGLPFELLVQAKITDAHTPRRGRPPKGLQPS